MRVFDTVREMRIGRNYDADNDMNLSENNSSESSRITSAHGDNINNKSEARLLTQEEVDEQIRNYIAPMNKRLQ